MLALVTARAAGAKGVKLADFLPDDGAEPVDPDDEQTPQEMSRQMRTLAAAFDARIG